MIEILNPLFETYLNFQFYELGINSQCEGINKTIDKLDIVFKSEIKVKKIF
jgi:hypothetical protein